MTRCRPETVHAIAAHVDQANLAVLATLLEHSKSPIISTVT
jgi:hypothetical protein